MVDQRLRRAASVAAAVLVAAAAAALAADAYVRFVARPSLRFPYLTGPVDPAEYARLASQPGWQEAHVTVGPDVRLNGLLRRPRGYDGTWVLFFPGNDPDQLQSGAAFLTALAGDHDWGAAVYADRGYDSSGGVPRIDDLANDAAAIFADLCARESIYPAQIQVVGFSIGGYLAVRAVDASVKRHLRPGSLTLLASVDDVVMFRRSFWSKLDPGDELRTGDYLARIPPPILVIQGTADATLDGPGQGRAIADTLENRRYVELPGVGHNALLQNAEALATVRKLIEDVTRTVNAAP